VPAIDVVFFREDNGEIPFLLWVDDLKSPKAVAQSMRSVILLAQLGVALRRPHADFLRDEVRELRTRLKKIRLRILYFFAKGKAVISHGFVKKGGPVPNKEIDAAIARRQRFLQNPTKHSLEFKAP